MSDDYGHNGCPTAAQAALAEVIATTARAVGMTTAREHARAAQLAATTQREQSREAVDALVRELVPAVRRENGDAIRRCVAELSEAFDRLTQRIEVTSPAPVVTVTPEVRAICDLPAPVVTVHTGPGAAVDTAAVGAVVLAALRPLLHEVATLRSELAARVAEIVAAQRAPRRIEIIDETGKLIRTARMRVEI